MEKKDHPTPEDTTEKNSSPDTHAPDDRVASDTGSEKGTHSGLRNIWKSTTTVIKRVHPTWYVTLGFVLLLAGVIVHYESRDDMRGYHGYGPAREIRISPYDHTYGHFDRMFEDMDRSFREMERRHERMMESLDRMPTEVTSGRYSGARIVDNSAITYSISKNLDTTSGTITSTESGTLVQLETELKNLGYTVEKKDTTLSFSGNTDTLHALMNLLR